MARLFDDAIAFAQAILRTNTAANLRECIRGLADVIGLSKPPLCRQAQPIGDIIVQRAVGLAIRHAALATPAGLLCGLILRKFCIYLAKIMRAI